MELDAGELESASKEFEDNNCKKMYTLEKKSISDECNGYKNETAGNPGWADVMQKILQIKKPKRKKTIVLSKAKKLCDVKVKEEKKDLPFEIEKVEGDIKTKIPEETEDTVQKPPIRLKEKKEKNLGIRIKPSIMDRERERLLQKIATKGVVQLFNAVKQQQGEINQKLSTAGPLERKREQVLKNINKSTFLDVLMGASKSIPVDNSVKDEQQEHKKHEKMDKGVWNVLREDFVMGTKLKDWDRKHEDEGDSSAPEDMDSDD
ncbi:RRP15-like protein [Xylocopa sonorina]|uniref:RRP15-like protein n=1 Tax=Xylocopa sonorina TaxID=1818115 RepID=UPI00403A8136